MTDKSVKECGAPRHKDVNQDVDQDGPTIAQPGRTTLDRTEYDRLTQRRRAAVDEEVEMLFDNLPI
jgi:hypothetical protein